MGIVLVDTGPLVAYLDAAETNHRWAVDQFDSLTEPVVTCEAVIAETCFLLARSQAALRSLADFLSAGIIQLDFTLSESHERVFSLMKRYSNVPMLLADACLVCMAEKSRGRRVFTLDSDFSIYRLNGRTPLTLITPEV